MVITASCGKDDATTPSLEDGKSTVIYDLPGDTQASLSGGVDGKENRPFYSFLFRFNDKKQIWLKIKADSTKWLQTADWDIAFTGSYNSELNINRTTSHTAILLLLQSYDAVNQAPSDAEFDQSKLSKVGWSKEETDGGWFSYDQTTHIMKALPKHTYVLRLPNGRFAKLQLLSAYKGNPPAVTDMFWPAPYFTFKYYVQQDGSRNLSTR